MQLYANNASSVLSAPVSSADAALLVADGTSFPSPSAGDFFLVTLDDGTKLEICRCTSRSGNVLNVQRGQETTQAEDFPADTVVGLRLTAATMGSFLTDAASDDKYYGRRNGAWEEVPTGGGGFAGRLTQNLGSGGYQYVVETSGNSRLGALKTAAPDVELSADDPNRLILSGAAVQARQADGSPLPLPSEGDDVITLASYHALVPGSIDLQTSSPDPVALSYSAGVFTQLGFRAAAGSGLAVQISGSSLEFSAGGLLDKTTFEPDPANNLIHDKLVLTDGLGVSHVGASLAFHPTDGNAETAVLTADTDGNLSTNQNFSVAGIASWQNAVVPSDERLKQNIKPFHVSLSFKPTDIVNRVEAKQYQYKETPAHQNAGLLAQDLQAFVPDAVYEDANFQLHIRQDYVQAVLWAAVHELIERVKQLEKSHG